jgi:hypothetical protein
MELVAEDFGLLHTQQSKAGGGTAVAAEVQKLLASGQLGEAVEEERAGGGAAQEGEEGEQKSMLRRQASIDDIVSVAASELALDKARQQQRSGSSSSGGRGGGGGGGGGRASSQSKQLMHLIRKFKAQTTVDIPAAAGGDAAEGRGPHVVAILDPLCRTTQQLSQVSGLMPR